MKNGFIYPVTTIISMKRFFLLVVLISFYHLSIAQSQSNLHRDIFDQTFIPDHTFTGSKLTGWHVVGDADWQAKDGEITGKAKPGSKGGWLVLDSSYQDIGFHALFKYDGDSSERTGILFRVEKTKDGGMKGVLMSIAGGGDVAPYFVTLDPQGNELTRKKLRHAGGIYYRVAPPVGNQTMFTGGFRWSRIPAPSREGEPPGSAEPKSAVYFPFKSPNTDLLSDEWNQIEVFLDEDVIRGFLNDGKEIGGAVEQDEGGLNGYGPIALYVGGKGKIQFKDVMWKDIAMKVTPRTHASPNFEVQDLNDMYYSWGASAGDFNRDGLTDVVAGPYIYYAPQFTKRREIYPAISVSPSKEFTPVNAQYVFDFNGDGWPDVLRSPGGAELYINPQGKSRRWESFKVLPSVESEITDFRDIDGDGKPELIYAAGGSNGAGGTVRYAKFDPSDPTKPWKEFIVSEKGYGIAHGIGTGDINGDGKVDILDAFGWWEQPKSLTEVKLWKYHPVAFSRFGKRNSHVGGALMAVYDVNGDGLNDVVTSLNAHGFGLAWFEQHRNKNGKITFTRHMVSDDYSAKNAGGVTFSQQHGSTFADMDGDGIPDFIVGKRNFTHLDNYYDPNPYGPSVIYWYQTVRNPKAPGGAELVPHLIYNRSGSGASIDAVDLNKDGAVDIVTSTDLGSFIFWNKIKQQKKK